MDIATFHKSRRFAEVKSGRIAYVEQGQGPVALFIHGVPVNGYHWRHVIERIRHRRRCIAIDLMGLVFTEIDLVANDSGGAIAQIFAAHHSHRLTSLVLTNCDVHDGWPPPQVLPLMEHARNGTIASVFGPTAERPDLARERYASGQSVPLFRSYADPSILTDDLIRLYLQPLLSSPERIDAFARYWLGFDNRHTVAIHDRLKKLEVPTLIVWGLKDIFFDVKWARWLKDTIPGARRVVEVEDARLFFPEDRPDTLVPPVLAFWDEVGRP
jgi:pimeloyl-ACP methyl ester carboxylesterase